MTEQRSGKTLAVVGYASIDRAMSVRSFGGADSTSIVTRRLSQPWPAPGGILHIVRAAAIAEVHVDAVSWVGADSAGQHWISSITSVGAGPAGIHIHGAVTPSAYIFYASRGDALCFYDEGDCHAGPLTDDQLNIIRAADCVLLTVGPEWASRQVLAEINDQSVLVWAVKQDRTAFPPDLVHQIIARADVVSYSAGEHSLFAGDGPLLATRLGLLSVRTDGAEGVDFTRITNSGRADHGHIAVERINGIDTTGAGDSFVGTLAAELARAGHPADLAVEGLRDAITASVLATSTMLQHRRGTTRTVPLSNSGKSQP